MTVAITAEADPRPNSSSAGIRYTKTGMVCIVSRMGLATRMARSEADRRMPVGRPMISASSTLASTMDSVMYISCHKPTTPTAHSMAAYRMPLRRLPRARQPSAKTNSTITNQGINPSSLLIVLTRVIRPWPMMSSNSHAALAANSRMARSMAVTLGLKTNGKLPSSLIEYTSPHPYSAARSVSACSGLSQASTSSGCSSKNQRAVAA